LPSHVSSTLTGPLDESHIAMAVVDLPATPVRFRAAGGAAGHEVIDATLAGGYATHLASDTASVCRRKNHDHAR